MSSPRTPTRGSRYTGARFAGCTRRNCTAPHAEGFVTSTVVQPHEGSAARETELSSLRAAFRELHGRRLAGFALLLLGGGAERAAALAAASLERGATQVTELRHPERAAAWLRADLLRHARGLSAAAPEPATLHDMRVAPPVAAALATLDPRSRAVVIAADVERFDLRDVEAIVGLRPAATARLLASARRRFAAAFDADATETTPGAIAAAVSAAAGRLGGLWGAR